MRPSWSLVRELFERALEANPPDLEGWLAQECPDNFEVRAEVTSLFEHHMRAGEFLAEPIASHAPALMDEQPGFPSGHVIGQYTIIRELGRGGMGSVYLATDAELGRPVALKAVPPGMAGDQSQRARLKREARAAASLNHPGICTVYALVDYEGDLFLATEYVDGHTLRDEITNGRHAPTEDVLRTAREIAAALAGAHKASVIHRDLKPENVMRTQDGRLKIVDFGLARVDGTAFASSIGTVTQTGIIVGTPAYMAPEQLNGDRGDARADVFAFGVLLYEYACGVHPFAAATTPLVIARILQSEAVPLEGVCPKLSHHLTAIIDRCLMKTPGDRFESAVEIAAALATVGRFEVKPVRRWWRTHQAIVIGLYFLASAVAWLIKEWSTVSAAVAIFATIGSAATAAGVIRGHLLFTERMNPPAIVTELRRAGQMTMVVDLLIAVGLAVDSALLLIGTDRTVAAVLSVGLAVGIAIARLVVEPATTAAAFPSEPNQGVSAH